MTIRLALSALALLLLFSACRSDDSAQEPTEGAQEAPIEAAAVAEEMVGTWTLTAVNDEPLPGTVGSDEGCAVQLSEGTIELGVDALYELDVLARATCGDDEAERMDRATAVGPFRVQGFELFFNDEVTRADHTAWQDRVTEEIIEREEEELEEEAEEGAAEDTPDLYDTESFVGTGVVRDTLLTVRLSDDLTTLTFVKD